MRSFRKGLELLVVYIVLIIGIFVIQFRTDLNIIEKIGNIQITLSKLENSEDPSLLQNKLQVNYNGLNFHADDQNPAKILIKDTANTKNINLISYSKISDNKILFNFSDDVKISFEVTSDDPEASLNVITDLPENVESCYIPYGLSYNLKIQKEEENRLILTNKKLNWAFTANKLADGLVCLTTKDSVAHLSVYDDTKKFSIDMIADLTEANEELYKSTVSKFTNNMMSMFRNALTEGSYTEQEIASYIAARSETGHYNEALEEIPSSFKKGNKRTYLTTPYFNNLSDMNVTLENTLKANATKISAAATSDSLDVYKEVNLAEQLCVHEKTDEVNSILQKALNADISTASIDLISGIIRTYVNLADYQSPYADVIYPVISKCFEKIEANSAIEDGKVLITDEGRYISVVQAVNLGIAIVRYGENISNQTYVKIGYAILNTYLKDATLDLKTTSALYPLIAYNNWYYPHFKVINPSQDDFIWAWTCAQDIQSSRDEKDNLSFVINFPLEHVHHIIIKGVTKFSSIYIYDVAYRTDPRFESYNSSGYVFREDSYTLLLKSRHKAQLETVKLNYTGGLPSRKADAKKVVKKTETKPAKKPVQKYSVILEVSSSKKKKAIIAELRAIRPDLSANDASKLFASAPTTIADGLTKEAADGIIARIQAAGGVASKK